MGKGNLFIRPRLNSQRISTMDRDQRRLDLEGLIIKLRTITRAVQLLPFLYGFLYILAMIVYLLCPDWISVVCDHLFYISVTGVAYNLILSRILRLCKWHRAACLVPLTPELVGLADQTLVKLSAYAELINICIIIVSTMLLLVAAYNVFLR